MNPATLPTTIKQKFVTIEFDNRKVVVRRMYWKAAKSFMKMLAAHVSKLGVTNAAEILPKLSEVIVSTDELLTFLVVNSSDITAEDLENLDLAQAAALVHVALEVNAGDELKNSFAGIAAALAGLLPATTTKPGVVSTPA